MIESLETCLDRWATQRPDKTALADRFERLTWAELARRVERVAHGLRALGVARGSAISCQLPNWNEYVLVLLAALRLGAVVNPIPPTYRASELRFMLGLLESQVLVVPGTFRGFDHAAMGAALRGSSTCWSRARRRRPPVSGRSARSPRPRGKSARGAAGSPAPRSTTCTR
jgi:cyclohexanecarboxylate-CoA ligase